MCPIRKPFSLFSPGEPLRCPAARRGPTSFSPFASGVVGRCLARSAPNLPRAVPHRALCVPRSGLVVCGDAAGALAPRSDVQGCPSRVPNSKTCVHILCRQAAVLPGRPRWSNVSRASCQRRRRALPRARRPKLVARGATSRAMRSPLRSRRLRRRGQTLASRRDVQGCPCRLPKSKTVVHSLSRRTVALPGRRCGPTSVSPVASGVAGRCLALSLQRAVPHRALCVPRSGLEACDDAAKTLAPRRDVQGCPCRVPNSKTVVLILPRRTAALPGRPPRSNVCLARCQRRRGALPCARRYKPVAQGATSRVLCALIRSCGLRRRGPRSCAASRRTRMSMPRAQFENCFLILCRQTAALPGRPPWPNVFRAHCQRRRGALPCAAL